MGDIYHLSKSVLLSCRAARRAVQACAFVPQTAPPAAVATHAAAACCCGWCRRCCTIVQQGSTYWILPMSAAALRRIAPAAPAEAEAHSLPAWVCRDPEF